MRRVILLAFAALLVTQVVEAGSCLEEYRTKVSRMKRNQKWRTFGEVAIALSAGAAGMSAPIASIGAAGVIGGVLVGGATGGFSWAMFGLPLSLRQEGIESSLVFMEQLNTDPDEVRKELYEDLIDKRTEALNRNLAMERMKPLTREQVIEQVGEVRINSLVDRLLDKVNDKRKEAGKSVLTYDQMKNFLLETEDSANYLCRHSWRGEVSYPFPRLFRRATRALVAL